MSAAAVSAASASAAVDAMRKRPRREHEASFFFWDGGFGCVSVKVLPGEFYVHDEDVSITTTLGSCVAACLHDPTAGIGGMNHFMLPESGDAQAGGRFGAFAMELLINEMLKRGARRGALQAKIFGGGQVMQSLAGTLIGEKNVEFVKRFLAQERIPVLGADVLDVYPRKICLFPRSGRVLCRRLPAAHTGEAVQQEAKYRANIVRQKGGEMELFG